LWIIKFVISEYDLLNIYIKRVLIKNQDGELTQELIQDNFCSFEPTFKINAFFHSWHLGINSKMAGHDEKLPKLTSSFVGT
jgi:hypothetical protein